MSHYTVLVIGDNIEDKLAPYDENTQVEPYPETCYCVGRKAKNRAWDRALAEMVEKYPIVNDILAKQKLDHANKKAEAETDPDEKALLRFNLFGHVPDLLGAFGEFCRGISKDGGPDHWKEKVELSDKYFAEDHDKNKSDPKCEECHGNGVVLSTYNPDSQWDWYQIGGRWFGQFVLNEGVTRDGRVDDPAWGLSKEEIAEAIKSNRADQAKFGDINWEKTGKLSPESIREANGLWDWIEGKLTDEEARLGHIFTMYKKEYYLERYGTREEYIRREGLFATYAVVTEDGKWVGQGKMGWWGMGSDSHEDAKNWQNGFYEHFLKDLKPDTLLTVVDCHI